MKLPRSSWCSAVVGLILAGIGSAQSFSSGSTGSDGALTFTTPGIFDFDPQAQNLNAAGDNIFNFTTITIGPSVTLRLRNGKLRGKPVIWLATGDVTITGTLDIGGNSGPSLASGVDWIANRAPTEPGPGGYPGGVGALPGVAAYPGSGPGGAPLPADPNCLQSNNLNFGNNGSFATAGFGNPPARTYGNVQLVPLVGGSGGSGGCIPSGVTASDAAGGIGGAGAGAIRIVSSTSITISGTINAIGGDGGAGRSGGAQGGAGSGGAVNLIAPVIAGGGTIRTLGGQAGNNVAGGGYLLFNAATNTYSGFAPDGIQIRRPLLAPPLPTPASTPGVTIVSVNGVQVAQPPLGQFQTPDVTINATNSVTINISAIGVPVGTVVSLNIQSELGPDQTIHCNPLAGTTASSTATCSASFPTSVSRILASASW